MKADSISVKFFTTVLVQALPNIGIQWTYHIKQSSPTDATCANIIRPLWMDWPPLCARGWISEEVKMRGGPKTTQCWNYRRNNRISRTLNRKHYWNVRAIFPCAASIHGTGAGEWCGCQHCNCSESQSWYFLTRNFAHDKSVITVE